MGNPFVHAELNTTDVDKAKAFYQKLFDWKLEDMPMEEGMTYTIIGVGEGTGGGMMKQMIPGAPSDWMPYVAVERHQGVHEEGEVPRRDRPSRRHRGHGHGLALASSRTRPAP